MGIIRKFRKAKRLAMGIVVIAIVVLVFRGLSKTMQDRVVDVAVEKIIELSIVQNSGLDINEEEFKQKAKQIANELNSEDVDKILEIGADIIKNGKLEDMRTYVDNDSGDVKDVVLEILGDKDVSELKNIIGDDGMRELQGVYDKYFSDH